MGDNGSTFHFNFFLVDHIQGGQGLFGVILKGGDIGNRIPCKSYVYTANLVAKYAEMTFI
jgi:hypothetical protein